MSNEANLSQLLLIVDDLTADGRGETRAHVKDQISFISSTIVKLIRGAGFSSKRVGYLFDVNFLVGDLKDYLIGETWFASEYAKTSVCKHIERMAKHFIVGSYNASLSGVSNNVFWDVAKPYYLIDDSIKFVVDSRYYFEKRDLNAYSCLISNIAKSGRVLAQNFRYIDTCFFLVKFDGGEETFVIRIDSLPESDKFKGDLNSLSGLDSYCDNRYYGKSSEEGNKTVSICLYHLNDHLDDGEIQSGTCEDGVFSLVNAKDIYYGNVEIKSEREIDDNVDELATFKSRLHDLLGEFPDGFSYQKARDLFYGVKGECRNDLAYLCHLRKFKD